jgi:hypothetical protein
LRVVGVWFKLSLRIEKEKEKEKEKKKKNGVIPLMIRR